MSFTPRRDHTAEYLDINNWILLPGPKKNRHKCRHLWLFFKTRLTQKWSNMWVSFSHFRYGTLLNVLANYNTSTYENIKLPHVPKRKCAVFASLSHCYRITNLFLLNSPASSKRYTLAPKVFLTYLPDIKERVYTL